MKFKDYYKKDLERLELEEDLYFDVADLFTQVRLEKGWTEKKLAKLLGTKQPGVARWESGASVPTIKILEKLAKIADKKLIIKFNK